MASNIKRDHHNLQRNLNLNSKYISNDGGDEGISIDNGGIVTMSSQLDIGNMSLTTSELDISSGDFTFDIENDIIFDAGGARVNFINAGSTTIIFDTNGGAGDGASMKFQSLADDGDYFRINTGALGATIISTVDDGGEEADLTLNIDGFIDINSAAGEDITLDAGGDINLDAAADVNIPANIGLTFGDDGEKIEGSGLDLNISSSRLLILDGDSGIINNAGNGTFKFYYDSDPDDYFAMTVVGATGATTLQTVSEHGDGTLSIVADGHVEFDGCGVGFDLVEQAISGSDTEVHFVQGNKHLVNFSGNITNLILIFPKTSGNFVLLLKQDGTGGRTITNYLAKDSGGDPASGSSTVKFAGGSNPDLTDDVNHVDIISIFWDSDNEIAYGVATLDFQF